MLAKLILAKGLIPCLLYTIGRIAVCTLGSIIWPDLGLFPALQSQSFFLPTEEIAVLGMQRVEIQQFVWMDTAFSQTASIQYEYNRRGQLIGHQTLDGSGSIIQLDSISYNAMGHPVRHHQAWPNQAISQINTWELTYEATRLARKVDQSSGLIHTYTYNDVGLRVAEYAMLASDSSFFLEEKYAYDDHHQLIEKVSRTSSLQKQWKKTYNKNGQLVRVVYRQDVIGTSEGDRLQIQTYAYDEEGRLTTQNTYGPDGKQQNQATFQYDVSGKLIEKRLGVNRYQYQWDDQERLVLISHFKHDKPVAQKKYAYVPGTTAVMAIRD